jgi:hypothetical protein
LWVGCFDGWPLSGGEGIAFAGVVVVVSMYLISLLAYRGWPPGSYVLLGGFFFAAKGLD